MHRRAVREIPCGDASDLQIVGSRTRAGYALAGLGAYKRVTRDWKDREEHNEGRSAYTAGVSWRSSAPLPATRYG